MVATGRSQGVCLHDSPRRPGIGGGDRGRRRPPSAAGWMRDDGLGRRAAPRRRRPGGPRWAGRRGARMSLAVRARRVVLPEGERAATVHTADGRITAVSEFADAPSGVLTLTDDEVLPG